MQARCGIMQSPDALTLACMHDRATLTFYNRHLSANNKLSSWYGETVLATCVFHRTKWIRNWKVIKKKKERCLPENMGQPRNFIFLGRFQTRPAVARHLSYYFSVAHCQGFHLCPRKCKVGTSKSTPGANGYPRTWRTHLSSTCSKHAGVDNKHHCFFFFWKKMCKRKVICELNTG